MVVADPAIETFDKCSYQIRIMLFRLMKQLDFYVHIDDIMSECQERWVQCYDDKYEDDKQFLRYMFVVMKNKIRDLKKTQMRYQRMHVSDPSKLDGLNGGEREGDAAHVRVWNEMAVDTKENLPVINAMLNEFVRIIEEKLPKDFQKKVFKLMVYGMPHKQIAEELGCSTGHVVKTKTEQIWPVVRDVMKINPDMYDKLIDSGRIYCK